MKIKTFEIRKEINGKQEVLYPSLIEINKRKYLIDCGYEETFEEFVFALDELGVKVTDLHAIIISHDDIDHLGALTLFKENNPQVIIYSSRIEEPSISGKIKCERLQQAENSLSSLPDGYKPWALQFIDQLKRIKRIPVDVVVDDKEILENEIQIIYTPGHTKGHISLYCPTSKTLIANDAIVIEGDNFEIANPAFTLDMEQAIQSIIAISKLPLEQIICYHGGIAKCNIGEKLIDLVERYKNKGLMT